MECIDLSLSSHSFTFLLFTLKFDFVYSVTEYGMVGEVPLVAVAFMNKILKANHFLCSRIILSCIPANTSRL